MPSMNVTHKCSKCRANLLTITFALDRMPIRVEVATGVAVSLGEDNTATLTCAQCGAHTPVQLIGPVASKLREERPQ